MKIDAEKLRDVRRYMDLTQAEMAEHLDVSPRTIANWEASGVPDSKATRIFKILGDALAELESYLAHRDAPIPEMTDDELHRLRQDDAVTWEPSWKPKNSLSPDARRSHLLQAFSDSDLLAELRTRALIRGDRVSHWDAERMERYQRFVAPRWDEDPDYSNMSDEDAKDYGLAAKPEDEDIAHDELPNQP